MPDFPQGALQTRKTPFNPHSSPDGKALVLFPTSLQLHNCNNVNPFIHLGSECGINNSLFVLTGTHPHTTPTRIYLDCTCLGHVPTPT